MKACRARRRAVARPRTKPWDMWSRWRTGADVARMEDVLDLYARPDPKRAPLVCCLRRPHQLALYNKQGSRNLARLYPVTGKES